MSRAADDRCTSVLAGGASSPVRAGIAVGGTPFIQSAGRGPYAYDATGDAHIDYVMAYGPLLFGHAHPSLVTGLDALAQRGTVFGSTHEHEERLAARISQLLPSIERLRFTSTGTEAVMSALRVARAYTGRALVLRFAGNYHGHFDAALHDAGASSSTSLALRSGIPAAATADVAVARYNDLADVDELLGARADALAAILIEPVVGNMGLVLPDPGFLEGLFERARGAGALVIFDEVITWLRLGTGGAQARSGLRPDLTALGKTMGGGLPLAAFGGRSEVMEALAPTGAAFTGGTFSGNPFCVAMGERVLDLIESDPEIYERLERSGRRLADGLRSAIADAGLKYPVTQLGSMVDVAFRPGDPPKNFAERCECDIAAFASFYHAMRERRVLLAPSINELLFLSTEHGDPVVDETVQAAHDAFAGVAAGKRRNSRH